MNATSDSLLPPSRERAVLLILAAVQFTHILDFMIMMPLGTQFMRLFGVGPTAFGLLVSSYTFAASASGFLAAFWIDRFERRRVLLWLYAGFILATALCGVATRYELLLGGRIVAGAFGGVLGALVLAIVADLVPYARRARATALVAAAFSISAVAGVPIALWFAAHWSWRAPFIGLAVLSTAMAFVAARQLPVLRAHLRPGHHAHPFAQLRRIFGVPNHLRAFTFTLALMFAGFTVIPFVAPYCVANVGIAEQDLAVVYFASGLATLFTVQIIGHLADRHGKRRVFTIIAIASILPIIVMTHLPPLPLPWLLPVTTVFFVFVTGRFGPAIALISGSAEPSVRGSFMSFNASLQQLAAGLASTVAGLVIARGPSGALSGYDVVGWIAVGATVLAVLLARSVRVVDTGEPRRAPG